MKKDMTSNLPSVKPTDYSFRQANLQDIRYISEQPESLNYEVYKDRLSKGHICYCAYNQDEVMCYVWFSFNTCGLFFGTANEVKFLPLSSNQVYSYNLYTYNKFRKKGIASQLHRYCNLSLRAKGITERCSIIGPSFIASMKISLSNGFVPQRMVYVFGIKKYKKVFIGPQKASSDLHRWKKWFENKYCVNSRSDLPRALQ